MGDTILHYVAANNLYRSAKVFIKYFTIIDVENDDGKTPVDIA